MSVSQKVPMPVSVNPSKDPLHGITLESILNYLVEQYGWTEMGLRIRVRCFQLDPSIKSSLTFLRKTPWARKKVEDWFVKDKSKTIKIKNKF